MSNDFKTEPSDLAPTDEAGEGMHIHKPKAAHSLREFLSEIGVIVVGVLIALALEQAVEALHWAHKVAEAKANLKNELSENAKSALERIAVSDCLDARLTALADDAETGKSWDTPADPSRLFASPYVVPLRLWDDTRWKSAQYDGTAQHMSDKDQANFAFAYSMIETLHNISARETETTSTLFLLTHLHNPSDSARVRALEAIGAAKTNNKLMALGSEQLLEDIKIEGMLPSKKDIDAFLLQNSATVRYCNSMKFPVSRPN